MNKQGGSWSREVLADKARTADQDWEQHDAAGQANGYYWVATDGRLRPIAIVGMHRAPEDSAFTVRAYFGAAVPQPSRPAVITVALDEFARLRPDQQAVWTHFRGARAGPDCAYLQAGFRPIAVATRVSPGPRRRATREVNVLGRVLGRTGPHSGFAADEVHHLGKDLVAAIS